MSSSVHRLPSVLSRLLGTASPCALLYAGECGAILAPVVWYSADPRGFAAYAKPDAEQKATPQRTSLPPAWQPPPNNPTTLVPEPRPTLAQTLQRIQKANTPLELHNAYRRDPPRLPPPIAAAKYSRFVQILRAIRLASPPPVSLSTSASSAASSSAPAPASQAPARGAPHQHPHPGGLLHHRLPALRGTTSLLRQIGQSWDVLLHLYTPAELATCVRASCEAQALLGQPVRGGAEPKLTAQSTAAPAAPAPASEPPGAAEGPLAFPVSRHPQLVKRTLELLLDGEGRELAGAGPQAVVDVSYGLMVAGYEHAPTWRTLGPMLREARDNLPPSGKAPGSSDGAGGAQRGLREQAEEVLQWTALRAL